MLIDWNLCKREFVKNVEVDEARINSLVGVALVRLERARNPFKGNISLSFEDYYEVAKELLTAYMLKFGMKSQNHQCLISFFYQQNKEREFEANLLQEMSFFRNRLNYYGEKTPESFYKNHKEDFEKIVKLLFGLIKEMKNKSS